MTAMALAPWRRIGRVLCSLILWASFGFVTLLVLAVLVIPKAAGAVPLTVLSGSMEPTLSAGSVVVVKPVDASASPPPGGTTQHAGWYVAVNGSSSNAGTMASPWSLAYALSQPRAVGPGDTVLMRMP